MNIWVINRIVGTVEEEHFSERYIKRGEEEKSNVLVSEGQTSDIDLITQ